jgi:acyl carrier protein
VADVLEIDAEQLSSDTDLTAIETFDSVSLLTLLIELDDRAGLKLGPAEAEALHYYRDIEALAAKQGIELNE